MYKVFVYGTLLKGERNHYLLREASSLQIDFWLKGYEIRLYKGFPYDFPYAFLNPNEHILGEIYQVNEIQLRQLDQLEGIDSGYYIRHFEPKIESFIYLKGEDDRENYPKICTGNWRLRD